MVERRGTILLNEEVGEPRQRVWHGERPKNPHRPLQRNRREEQPPSHKRPQNMKTLRERPAMRQHVMRPKFAKAPRRPVHGQRFYYAGTFTKSCARNIQLSGQNDAANFCTPIACQKGISIVQPFARARHRITLNVAARSTPAGCAFPRSGEI